ncbi:MAG TPA: AMP-binding protein [Acidimicrobiales bacterium]|nr:AMP-binding protein [Acidimicrobiales bacterium]
MEQGPGDPTAQRTDLLARVSLPLAWSESWKADPTAVYVRDVDGTGLDGFDLLDRTARVAGRLHAAGLVAGDRVLVSGETSADLVVAHIGALRLGLVVVPVNPSFSRREVDAIVEAAAPRAAILEGEELRSWMPAEVCTTGIDVDLADGIVPELDGVASDDPALLPFTSGTTGTPKGVVLSHGNLLASSAAVAEAWRWEATDTLVLCLPLFHVHGLGVGLHTSLLVGGTVILQRGFDAEAVLAACDEATMFFGVPTMWSRLAAADGLERLGKLRLCVSGSAPLAPELLERIRDASGQTILERYGMTETLMLTTNPYDGERRAGTVGMPFPGVEVRLDADTAEIEVRGANVFAGYLDQPDATREAFTDDGWFRTGDIGALDDDGYLSIVGRAKELIITGGYNVYPREIEDVLRGHPSVHDVAVVGTPSEEWGEVVTAYVESDDSFDANAIVGFAAERLAPYKRPRLIHRIDALPRNPLGKVQRDRLGQ